MTAPIFKMCIRDRNSTPKQRAAAQTLGLNKIGKTVTREDTPALRGQLLVLRHLVTVEEAD